MRRKLGVSNSELPIHCKYDKLVSTFSLKPNPENPNIHSNEQIKLLAKIIKKNGWRDKIVVSNQSGMIVRGHGRFEAAKHLRMPHVPVEYQDYEAYIDEVRDLVADNKISEFSHIDKDQMLKLLTNLDGFDIEKELDDIGFTESEITKLTGEIDAEVGGQDNIEEFFGIYVECNGEEMQKELLSKFEKEGLTCRALIS